MMNYGSVLSYFSRIGQLRGQIIKKHSDSLQSGARNVTELLRLVTKSQCQSQRRPRLGAQYVGDFPLTGGTDFVINVYC